MIDMFYWTATVVAGLIVTAAGAGYASNAAAGLPVVPVAALLIAAAIWLAGWSCHAMFRRR